MCMTRHVGGGYRACEYSLKKGEKLARLSPGTGCAKGNRSQCGGICIEPNPSYGTRMHSMHSILKNSRSISQKSTLMMLHLSVSVIKDATLAAPQCGTGTMTEL